MDPDQGPRRPRSERARSTLRRVGDLLVWATVLAGVVPRVALWWEDRAFWRDELALIQSLDTYSISRLLGPLSDAQSAPPGWLLAERLVTDVFGIGERAYRLLPLLFGCATLVLVALLAMRLVRRRWTAAIAVLAVGTNPALIFYSAQAKQYTTDLAAVTGLLLLAVHLLDQAKRPEPDALDRRPFWRSPQLWWYVLIGVGVWFSHGLMLSAPLVAGWVAVVQWRRGRRSARRLAAELTLPAASVLLAALWARRLTADVVDFQAYWEPFLRQRGTGIDGILAWTGRVVPDFVTQPLAFAHAWVGLLLIAGLAAGLAMRHTRESVVVLVFPLIAPWVAGLFAAYPFGRRLVFFAVPGLVVLLSILADAVMEFLASRVRVSAAPVVATVAGVVVAGGLVATTSTGPGDIGEDLTFRYGVDDYRVQLRFIESKWADGDLLIIGNGDRAAFRVYGRQLGLPADRALRAMPSTDEERTVGCPLPPVIEQANKVWLMSGDVVPVYAGELSRFALAAPILDRFRVVHFEDKGRVTVQALLPGRAESVEPPPARCLSYAPVGPPGAEKWPPGLPTN